MTPHTETVVGWADFTRAAMHVKLLRGSGHLFVLEKEAGPELLSYLQETLLQPAAAAAAGAAHPTLQSRTITAPPRLSQDKLFIPTAAAGGERSLDNLQAGLATGYSSVSSSEP